MTQMILTKQLESPRKTILSFRPITSRLASKFFKRAPDDERIIETGCTWELPPPIHAPDEISRIIRHESNLNPADNLRTLTSPTFKQGLTKAYLWKDAIIADATAMAGGRINVIGDRKRCAMLSGRPEAVHEIALCSTYQTENFFGHWLQDGLGHELLAKDLKLERRTFEYLSWQHKDGYRDLAALEARPIHFARVDRLWQFEDSQLNNSRVKRLKRLRARFAKVADRGKKVFVARGATGQARHLVNEGALCDDLAKRGFTILHPEKASPQTIARTLAGAELVVGVEGSNLAHAVMAMPEGGTFLTIQPPERFNAVYRSYCGVMGLRFAFTVADKEGDAFRLDLDRLLRTIDLSH